MVLSCCIIDDEPLALSLLESYARKTPFLELRGRFSSALKALPVLRESPVDLLFLDIQMPELNGMEFSRLIQPETRIIFTTAFQQYAVDSYRVNALDYLLKPISYSDFLQAAQKALQWFEMVRKPAPATAQAAPEAESIFVKAEHRLVQVDLDRILYIEGLKDYVKIHIEGEAHALLSLMSMKSLEDLLPKTRFVRIHRSYIVHTEKISAIERSRVVIGKEYLPISDSYKQSFFEILSKRSIFSNS